MAATNPQTLFTEGKCYECNGPLTPAMIMRLALEARILTTLVPGADTSASALLAYASCYSCYGASLGELMELALLDQISQAL